MQYDVEKVLRDPKRLEALHLSQLLDTPPEEAFDRLTRLASHILDAPVAMVSLIDHHREYLKSAVGVPEPVASGRMLPLSHSFCKHAVASGEPLIIGNTREHPLGADNLAVPEFGVAAYAGIPLLSSSGHALGSFCVIDIQPRSWTEQQITILKDLAAAVMTEIELRRAKADLELRVQDRTAELSTTNALLRAEIHERLQAEMALRTSQENLAAAQRLAHMGSWSIDLRSGALDWSDEAYRILGHAPYSIPTSYETFLAAVLPDDRELITMTSQQQRAYVLEYRIRRTDGEIRVIHEQSEVIFDATGAAVRRVGTILDITERKQLEEQLAHQAFHDSLTQLPNRALFVDRLERALARRDRRNTSAAVLFLDLDRFKIVNDSLGHDVGDQLLCAVADRLQLWMRQEDTLARFGGDEFTILIENITDVRHAVQIAERVQAELQAPFKIGEHDIVTTASIGIALSTSGTTPEELLRDADIAMYRAKLDGKARHTLFDARLNSEVLARMTLETDLRRAIERQEFQVYYQPIVRLKDGRISEVEALVRWEHPQRGLISPATFISLAEETGLIIPIGQLVLETACRQVREWQLRFPDEPPLTLSVNLSARQFQHAHLVMDVAHTIRTTGLAPSSLKLELTESVTMHDAEATIATLRELKALGVQLAIDDFGTGYSSLAYLKRFPIDVLKIDRSFVDRLGQNAEDTAIVRAIVTLAKTLKLVVTGEGIETVEQLNHLEALGCDLGQGYYFARPLSADAAATLLETHQAPMARRVVAV